jgi:hypothetical protein
MTYKKPTTTRFKKRARLGKSSPNIAQPRKRHKNHSPRILEDQISGECATSAEKRVTLLTRAQVRRWAVALIVTGQTGAGQSSLPQRILVHQEQGLVASMDKKIQGVV